MKNLLYLVPLLALGCNQARAPVVICPETTPVSLSPGDVADIVATVPEGKAAQSAYACQCDPNLKAEVAAEIQAVKNRVVKLEVSIKPRGEKFTQPKPLDNSGPPKPPAKAPVQADSGMCGPGGCSSGPARRAVGKGLFFRRR